MEKVPDEVMKGSGLLEEVHQALAIEDLGRELARAFEERAEGERRAAQEAKGPRLTRLPAGGPLDASGKIGNAR